MAGHNERGWFMSAICWLLSTSVKVSALVVMLALLATVHELRSNADEVSLKLGMAEQDLSAAKAIKDDASRAYTESQTRINQLQTDLANSKREAQDLQVQLSKKTDLQRDLDRKTAEAKSAKNEVLVLTQKLQEVEAAARKQDVEKNKDTSAALQALEGEKKTLLEKVSTLESTVAQLKSEAEKQKAGAADLKKTAAQLAEAEKTKEMLIAKSKGQDKKIEELTAKISSLEKAKN